MDGAKGTETQSYKFSQGPSLNQPLRRMKNLLTSHNWGSLGRADRTATLPTPKQEQRIQAVGTICQASERRGRALNAPGNLSSPLSRVHGASPCGFLQTPRGPTSIRNSKLVEKKVTRSCRVSETGGEKLLSPWTDSPVLVMAGCRGFLCGYSGGLGRLCSPQDTWELWG